MGDWNINIQGVGCHHNPPNADGVQTDAEKMAAQFVLALRKAGHSVSAATFTAGSKTDLDPSGIQGAV